ncbi:MAG: DNA cytosine methyltransferase [Candidatus Zixiibacteriota bacterium]
MRLGTQKKLRVLDLFAGGGGFSLGFDLVSTPDGNKAYEIVLAVDSDKYACQTLRKYFASKYGDEDIVLEGDLTDNNIHRKVIEKCNSGIDIIIGGPPCQSFSLIGPRSGYGKGKEKRYNSTDKLYIEYLKLVKQLEPSFIIFENVKGILSKKDGNERRYIDVISSDFKNLGYSFESESQEVENDYIILNAADYGVPQTRERVFLIGNNRGIKNPYPSATHRESEYITLHEAIGDLPRLRAKATFTGIPKKDRLLVDKHNAKVFNGSDQMPYHDDLFRKHYESIGDKARAFLDFVSPNGQALLTHHLARGQKRNDILLFRGMRQGMTALDIFRNRDKTIKDLKKLIKYDMTSFLDKYKKQSWDKPCSTIFAHLEKDGNRFIHPDGKQARTITPREAARIQSFPDWYEFEGPLMKKFNQIGNAVPPLLAAAIAKSLITNLR